MNSHAVLHKGMLWEWVVSQHCSRVIVQSNAAAKTRSQQMGCSAVAGDVRPTRMACHSVQWLVSAMAGSEVAAQSLTLITCPWLFTPYDSARWKHISKVIIPNSNSNILIIDDTIIELHSKFKYLATIKCNRNQDSGYQPGTVRFQSHTLFNSCTISVVR